MSVPGPVVGVSGIAFDDRGRVLVIQRGKPPGQGLWSVPGGRVELGEPLRLACAREFFEETGLTVDVGSLVEVLEPMSIGGKEGFSVSRAMRRARPDVDYHYVIISFLVTVTGGEPAPASDVSALRWCSLDELEALPHTDGLIPILRRALARVNPGM